MIFLSRIGQNLKKKLKFLYIKKKELKIYSKLYKIKHTGRKIILFNLRKNNLKAIYKIKLINKIEYKNRKYMHIIKFIE